MDRELMSKRELEEILQTLVDERTEKDNDHVRMTISWNEPDENGGNWKYHLNGNSSWGGAVQAIAVTLQRQYNLVNGGNS